jgi:hypothetical protein
MRIRLFIKVLSRESQWEAELPCPTWVFTRRIIPKRITIIPLPFYST